MPDPGHEPLIKSRHVHTVQMDSDAAVCLCGHPRSAHHAERGPCMASTPTETWACDCDEYRDERDRD